MKIMFKNGKNKEWKLIINKEKLKINKKKKLKRK